MGFFTKKNKANIDHVMNLQSPKQIKDVLLRDIAEKKETGELKAFNTRVTSLSQLRSYVRKNYDFELEMTQKDKENMRIFRQNTKKSQLK